MFALLACVLMVFDEKWLIEFNGEKVTIIFVIH